MSRKRASQLRQSPDQNTLNVLSFNGLRSLAPLNPTGGKPAVSRWEVYRPCGPRQPPVSGTGKHAPAGFERWRCKPLNPPHQWGIGRVIDAVDGVSGGAGLGVASRTHLAWTSNGLGIHGTDSYACFLTHRQRCVCPGSVPEWTNGADCKSVGLRLRGFESLRSHYRAGPRRARPQSFWGFRACRLSATLVGSTVSPCVARTHH